MALLSKHLETLVGSLSADVHNADVWEADPRCERIRAARRTGLGGGDRCARRGRTRFVDRAMDVGTQTAPGAGPRSAQTRDDRVPQESQSDAPSRRVVVDARSDDRRTSFRNFGHHAACALSTRGVDRTRAPGTTQERQTRHLRVAARVGCASALTYRRERGRTRAGTLRRARAPGPFTRIAGSLSQISRSVNRADGELETPLGLEVNFTVGSTCR